MIHDDNDDDEEEEEEEEDDDDDDDDDDAPIESTINFRGVAINSTTDWIQTSIIQDTDIYIYKHCRLGRRMNYKPFVILKCFMICRVEYTYIYTYIYIYASQVSFSGALVLPLSSGSIAPCMQNHKVGQSVGDR